MIKIDVDNDVFIWIIDDFSSMGCFVGGRVVKYEILLDNILMFFGLVFCQLKCFSMSDFV